MTDPTAPPPRSPEPPQVDVLLRTVGDGPFLREAIQSVLAQRHARWRLIVSVDPARPGGAEAVVRPYLGLPGVSFVRTTARGNAALHLTKLLAATSAPYVAFLDDDDRWHEGFLARRVGWLDDHPDCGFVFSGSRVVDAAGRVLQVTASGLEPGLLDGRRLIAHMLARGNVVTASSVVLRRALCERVGCAFDPRFTVGYDQEMWVRLAAPCPVGYLDLADVDYRIHPDQATSAAPDCLERVRLLDHLEDVLRSAAPDLPLHAHLPRRRRALMILGAALDLAERGDGAGARRQLRRAARLFPPGLLHPAAPIALAGSALGPRSRRGLTRLRSGVRALPRKRESFDRARAMGHPIRWSAG